MTTDPLPILLARADHLSADEADLLRTRVTQLQADLAQARRTAGGLMAKVQQLGGAVKRAEAERNSARAIADVWRADRGVLGRVLADELDATLDAARR